MDLSAPDISKASYWTEWDERGERLVMPLKRGWKVVGGAFVALGLFAFQHLNAMSWPPSGIDWLWLATLFAMLLFLFVNSLTSLLAREVLWIEGGCLVHGWNLFGIKRERRYVLGAIQALSANREDKAPNIEKLISPLRDFGKAGWVTFDYNGESVGIGAALDQAHAQQVVLWIARRAPRRVIEP